MKPLNVILISPWNKYSEAEAEKYRNLSHQLRELKIKSSYAPKKGVFIGLLDLIARQGDRGDKYLILTDGNMSPEDLAFIQERLARIRHGAERVSNIPEFNDAKDLAKKLVEWSKKLEIQPKKRVESE